MKIKLLILFFIAGMLFQCEEASKTDPVSEPSLDEMIGQMLMMGFRGFTIDEVSSQVKENIKSGAIGNIILFDYDVINKEAVRNIKSPDQVRKLISDLQDLSSTLLLVAVDQEGGRVNRLKTRYGFPASVSNAYLGTLDQVDSTRFYANRNALLLKDLGFNVNFAPSVDLNINPENPVIGKIERSYGEDPESVIKHADVWIDEHYKNGIISTIKHFPGHGSSHTDSHYGITDITDYWSEKELIPFEKLAKKEGVGIMSAHVVNKKLDTVPATLSEKTIKSIIRDQWNFDGLLFSDDLHMGAVNDLYAFETILQKSIEAGVDILVFGNNLKYDEQIATKVSDALKKMISEGVIEKSRIRASYDRILRVKNQIQ